MTGVRLTTALWVEAERRRLEVNGFFVTVLHQGDRERGGILLKVFGSASSVKAYEQTTDFNGQTAWRLLSARVFGEQGASEIDIDQAIQKRLKYDADCWVLEIEDPKGLYSPPGPLLDPL